MPDFFHIIEHTFFDAVKMLPFLFLTYLFLEYLEHKGNEKFVSILQHSGKLGPLGGAILGCIPQCGFSVAAANLYAGRIISAGALAAVFISTSDEAIPILIANPDSAGLVLKLIAYKLIFAVFAGFLLDFILRHTPVINDAQNNHLHEDCHNVYSNKQILLSALKHTLFIALFIFAVLLILEIIIHYLGEDKLSALLMTDSVWQPVIAGLIGLIPNCAPSVILTQLYITGGIDVGTLFCGLSTSAGMGIVLLFKNNRNLKQNLLLLGYIYCLSVLVGFLL